MTDALMDRIKAHRSAPDVYDPPTFDQMADRIEELEKERDELGRKLNMTRYGQPDFAWSMHEDAMTDLRAKLTKAARALKFYAPQTLMELHLLAEMMPGNVPALHWPNWRRCDGRHEPIFVQVRS